MLRNLNDLENYKISATDGDVGHVKDFYFDDDTWVVRYLVVDAGSWLSRRKVLISPISVHHPDWQARTLPVSISKEKVKNSPDFDSDKPVSRQNEEQFIGYYGYPLYWGGDGIWGAGPYPSALAPEIGGYGADQSDRERQMEALHRDDDPHLRSCNTVTGYHIHASDGEIGHVCGFLIDDQTWAIHYLVIDTRNWWGGHKVLIAPPWISGVEWADRTVSVDFTRESIKAAPHYDPAVDWSRDQELNLHRHYGLKDDPSRSRSLETEI